MQNSDDGAIVDMRYTLVEEFDERLRSLEHCDRCAGDKDEKCLDRGLADEDRFSIDDVACGCGCWTRWAFRVQLGLADEDVDPNEISD